jgi:hypothetical protein
MKRDKMILRIEAAIPYYGPTSEDVRLEDGQVLLTIGPPFAGMPRWKQPPHEFLAGLNLTQGDVWETVVHFVRRYGPLAERQTPIASWRSHLKAGDQVWIDVPHFWGLQKQLQAAWRGDREALEEIKTGLTAELELDTSRKGLELRVRDLWTLIMLLFLQDYAKGKAKVCPNPDCRSTPFFLQSRRGQTYCSHRCAVLINVHRFRARLNKTTRKDQERPATAGTQQKTRKRPSKQR